ncbi:ATP-grasp domain-containing protein [Bifidobacterium sp. ESL0704]|uniref:ATP-grasp domain-containing protein n=1 Tax=Bifidobacterium sp. ESL0704 TaxID=2983219 RepID=UPI0023F8D7A6|nr:ATP-grasp domain-containing protein [Bifidobacterium sp. ESL0704]WEV53549.1 ATP-grasp domain-containing protein [Bifidobacterium sp. ESL0704]
MMHFYFVNQRAAAAASALKCGATVTMITTKDSHEYDALLSNKRFDLDVVNDPYDALEVARSLSARGVKPGSASSVCIGLGDDSSEVASLVNGALSLAGGRCASYQALENMRDKYRLRTLVAISAPQLTGDCVFAAQEGEVRAFFADHRHGIVIKPRDQAGSRGVVAVEDLQSLKSVLLGLTYPVLVEERFVGHEYSVESLTWRKQHTPLVVTAKTTGGETGLVETEQRQPADIGDDERLALTRAASTVLDIAGYEYGLSHIEFIVQEGMPKLVEAHGRVGGDRISDMMLWSTGMNGFERLARAYIDDFVTAPQHTGRGAQIVFPDLSGYRGNDAQWLREMQHQTGTVEAAVLLPKNERGPIRCSSDRHALVLSAFSL